MKATELIPGKIYKDIETVKSPTYLEFVKYDNGRPMFRYVSGDRCYLSNSDGFIGFLTSKGFYEVGESECMKFNIGNRSWFRSLLRMFSIKRNRN